MVLRAVHLMREAPEHAVAVTQHGANGQAPARQRSFVIPLNETRHTSKHRRAHTRMRACTTTRIAIAAAIGDTSHTNTLSHSPPHSPTQRHAINAEEQTIEVECVIVKRQNNIHTAACTLLTSRLSTFRAPKFDTRGLSAQYCATGGLPGRRGRHNTRGRRKEEGKEQAPQAPQGRGGEGRGGEGGVGGGGGGGGGGGVGEDDAQSVLRCGY